MAAVLVVALLALSPWAASASANPLALTFTEDRANVGVQLADAPMFAAPDTAPFQAQIDPGTGSITAGTLQVPQFSTFITNPVNADVTVDFNIGVITGSFNQATGALSLSGEAGGTLTANGKKCTVSTVPPVLNLTTAGSSGGANPRTGTPFTVGLTGPGAIAGQWTDMNAVPVTMEDTTVCETVDERIGGPGGIWLVQAGDFVPPAAPQLTGTDPGSPSWDGNPRILGSAEAGSTVRVYASPNCTGAPVATRRAAELGSGIAVSVGPGATAYFSATATDAAANTSACSAAISYTRLAPPPPACVVPKLKGKSLRQARTSLKAAHCGVGKVHRPMHRRGRRPGPLVVKSSSPSAGKIIEAGGKVSLSLKPSR